MQTRTPHTSAIHPTRARHWSIPITAVLLVAVTAGIGALANGSTVSMSSASAPRRSRTSTRRRVPGFERFVDVNGIAWWTCTPGAMGVQYVNHTLGDRRSTSSTPNAMDQGGGAPPTLVASEYVVLRCCVGCANAWPLFETEFHVTASPNRFGFPDFYSLHVWAWRDNPAGLPRCGAGGLQSGLSY